MTIIFIHLFIRKKALGSPRCQKPRKLTLFLLRETWKAADFCPKRVNTNLRRQIIAPKSPKVYAKLHTFMKMSLQMLYLYSKERTPSFVRIITSFSFLGKFRKKLVNIRFLDCAFYWELFSISWEKHFKAHSPRGSVSNFPNYTSSLELRTIQAQV